MKTNLLWLAALGITVATPATASTTINTAISATGTKTFTFTTQGGPGLIEVRSTCDDGGTGLCDPAIYIFKDSLAGDLFAYNDNAILLDIDGEPSPFSTRNSLITTFFDPGTYVASVGLSEYDESFDPGAYQGLPIPNKFSETEARTGVANFNPGEIDFTIDFSGSLIVAAEATTAVPEPATWAMMIVGFAATGASLRRHRHANRVTTLA